MDVTRSITSRPKQCVVSGVFRQETGCNKRGFLPLVNKTRYKTRFVAPLARNMFGKSKQYFERQSCRTNTYQGYHVPQATMAPPTPSPSTDKPSSSREREDEAGLFTNATVYGIPRDEWLRLQTPARYLGNELGAVHKDWDSASVRFSLTYPEVYEVGASNLGHIVLYSVLNETEGLLCDRCYMPADDMQAMLARHSRPLFAVESRRPLGEFDTLGFSLAYELGATNVLAMLKLANIPVTRQERQEGGDQGVWDVEDGGFPLIFAGGPTATSNPEPFSDFFDFFALGDGEDLLPEIGQCMKRCKSERLSREETLFRLATEVKGVYVPMFYDSPPGWGGAVFAIREGVPPRVLRRTALPDPLRQIGLVPYVGTVHDRLTIEIRRGCTRGCRFCQPGMLTRPARDAEPSEVVQAVEQGLRTTGYNEFSLLSLSCSDYLALPSVGLQIKNKLKDENVTLSLPSQRVDRFDENIANIVSGGARKSGITFAPEAGTQRLRDIINKGLTDEELLRGVKTAWDQGWIQVKLYFMVGLPGETDADIEGIVDTIKMLQEECRRGKMHLAVSTTISNFTPKPHTPFQWHSVSTEEFLRKHQVLLDKFKAEKLHQVKYNITPIQISAMEDFIGRGDRSICQVVKRAWELGASNDGWWYNMDEAYAKWNQAIEESGLTWKYRQVEHGEWDVLEKLGDKNYRKQGGGGKGRVDRGEFMDERLKAPLPWDHVDTGISKAWLTTDLQRALEANTIEDCSHGECSECGVCGDDFGENIVAEVPPVPEFKGHYQPNSDRAQRLLFRFGKVGSMVYIGHLDLVNVLERALRRAALPVSMDMSPFHSRPRIKTALPLPLGASSSCELLEIEFTQNLDPEVVRAQLASKLPAGLPLYSVEELPVKRLNGRIAESTAKLLESCEWQLAVELLPKQDDADPETIKDQSATSWQSGSGVEFSPLSRSDQLEGVRACVQGALQLEELHIVKQTKKKNRKRKVELRGLLKSMSVEEDLNSAGEDGLVVVRALGKATGGGELLTPDICRQLLQAGAPHDAPWNVVLRRVHRSGLVVSEPPPIPVNMGQMRSFVHSDAYQALNRKYGVEFVKK